MGEVTVIENQKFQLSFLKALAVCALWITIPFIIILVITFIFFIVSGTNETAVSLYQSFIANPFFEFTLSVISLGLAMLIITRKKWHILEIKFWNNNNFYWIIGTVLVAFGLNIIVSEIDNAVRYFIPMSDLWMETFNNLYSLPLGIYILQVVIGAPVMEELFMRGVIAKGLANRYSLPTAIILTALLFGVIHLNIWQFTSAFVGGLFITWLYLSSGALLLSMLAHAVHNGASLLIEDILHLRIPGYNTEGLGLLSHQPLWFDILGILLIILGFFCLYQEKKQKKLVNSR